jgi:hypothetical protein
MSLRQTYRLGGPDSQPLAATDVTRCAIRVPDDEA